MRLLRHPCSSPSKARQLTPGSERRLSADSSLASAAARDTTRSIMDDARRAASARAARCTSAPALCAGVRWDCLHLQTKLKLESTSWFFHASGGFLNKRISGVR
eukprot:2141907-Prymnesium_polylepis.1